MKTSSRVRRDLSLGILCGLLMLGEGCKNAHKTLEQPSPAPAAANPVESQPKPPGDRRILHNIRAKIAAESALKRQDIHVTVANQVATLTGSVSDEASRALAAADSGSVDGVKTVINNLTIAPHPAPTTRTAEAARPRRQPFVKRPPPPPPPPAQAEAAAPPPPPPAPEQVRTIAPPAPPPPPPPVVRTVTLPAGTVIPVRMTDTLDSSTTQPDSIFHGSLATDLIVDGMVAAPRGAAVVGRVISAKQAGHFSGSSELSIELTKIDIRGDTRTQEISLVTDAYTAKGAGRGKNTAMKSGGGAALGALIGALAGGGKGAAIGAVTGGGIGAGSNGIKRGQQVQIPTETLVNFRLQSPVSMTTSRKAGTAPRPYRDDQGPVLHRAQAQ